MKRKLTAAIAALLMLSMVGCNSSPIDILNLAIGAAELVLPLIGGIAHVDPAVTTAVEGYLSAASGAIAQASDILNSPGLTDAQKSAAIVAAFAGIAAPVVPPKYQAVANAVQTVAQYIARFLGSLPAPTGIASARTAVTHTLRPADREKVDRIKARAVALKTAVRQGAQ